MRSFVLILVLSFLAFKAFAHGGHVAVFNYTLAENTIHLEFRIETEVLEHYSLGDKYVDFNQRAAWCLADYIAHKTRLTINGKDIVFELDEASQNKELVTVKMSAKVVFSGSDKVEVVNTCFYEFDRGFSNRVVFEDHKQTKSYLLNVLNKSAILNFK